MAFAFRLPDLGEGLTEGEVGRWLVAVSQEIAEDDPLVEIVTDKTTVEIPSPAGGVVTEILVSEGEVVPVGTVLVVIDDGGDADASSSEIAAGPARVEARVEAAVERHPASKVRATPLVRRIAAELGVDLAMVAGTGPHGQITEGDVRAAVPQAAPAAGERREKVRGVRRAIVEHLTRSHREVSAVTFVEECDFTGIDVRKLVASTLKAVAAALHDFPELNARFEGDEIVYLDRYDLGVAVQTSEGVVVPVVRACDSRTLDDLDADVRRLAEGARAGTLVLEELRGSTFTVTSAGKLGGVLVTPLVNHPEVGILGLHRIADRPVVRDGQIVVRPIGHVSLSFDHRVVDGARAAGFCLRVIEQLQSS